MTHSAISKLVELKKQHYRSEYPNMPEHTLPTPKYSDKTANGLTKCVIDFITLSGGMAERISNTGRYVDGRVEYTDVLGHTREFGSVKWIKGSGTLGTADISAVVNGKTIKIEIKIGKDRQSEHQKKYQESVERAGGEYWIVCNFEEFYNRFLNINN
jgi:hypothetical protein